MAEQKCPSVEQLQALIKRVKEGLDTWVSTNEEEIDEYNDLVELLSVAIWAKDFLLNRRNYHRKTQIKRKLMAKMIDEQQLGQELDEMIKAQYGEHLEKFDDNTFDED